MSQNDKMLNNNNQANFETDEERIELVQLILDFFEEWKIKKRDQLVLLGLREKSRSMLSYYRTGKTPLPFEQDKLDRASLLAMIYRNLYALFPENKDLRIRWINNKNKMLNNLSPLEVMTKQGILGIAKIVSYLDFQLVH